VNIQLALTVAGKIATLAIVEPGGLHGGPGNRSSGALVHSNTCAMNEAVQRKKVLRRKRKEV
jgi:hypothetical protein